MLMAFNLVLYFSIDYANCGGILRQTNLYFRGKLFLYIDFLKGHSCALLSV